MMYSKDTTVAANLMPFMVIMCELFNGVLRPQMQMPAVWRYTMYYVAPFTYWIGGILSTVLAGQPIVCAENDLSFFVPPEGQTCAVYAEAWLSSTTGYLVDPGAMARCGYCKYSVADDVSFLSLSLLYLLSVCLHLYSLSIKADETTSVPRRTKPQRRKALALLWNIYRICRL